MQLSGREYACVCIIKQQSFRFLKKELSGYLRRLQNLRLHPSGPCVERGDQKWLLRTSAFLRLLGYMDTLVHFGRFSLATLGKAEIDSYPPGN